MSEDEKESFKQVLLLELSDAHKRMDHATNTAEESFHLGVASGIVTVASHLGIVIREDLVEE